MHLPESQLAKRYQLFEIFRWFFDEFNDGMYVRSVQFRIGLDPKNAANLFNPASSKKRGEIQVKMARLGE